MNWKRPFKGCMTSDGEIRSSPDPSCSTTVSKDDYNTGCKAGI